MGLVTILITILVITFLIVISSLFYYFDKVISFEPILIAEYDDPIEIISYNGTIVQEIIEDKCKRFGYCIIVMNLAHRNNIKYDTKYYYFSERDWTKFVYKNLGIYIFISKNIGTMSKNIINNILPKMTKKYFNVRIDSYNFNSSDNNKFDDINEYLTY